MSTFKTKDDFLNANDELAKQISQLKENFSKGQGKIWGLQPKEMTLERWSKKEENLLVPMGSMRKCMYRAIFEGFWYGKDHLAQQPHDSGQNRIHKICPAFKDLQHVGAMLLRSILQSMMTARKEKVDFEYLQDSCLDVLKYNFFFTRERSPQFAHLDIFTCGLGDGPWTSEFPLGEGGMMLNFWYDYDKNHKYATKCSYPFPQENRSIELVIPPRFAAFWSSRMVPWWWSG